MKPLAFFALLAALVVLGCASVTASLPDYYSIGGEDQDLDSLQVEAKYFNEGSK